jgi:hypothetical protein
MVAKATSGAGCQDSETNKIHLDYRQIKITVKVIQYENEETSEDERLGPVVFAHKTRGIGFASS